MTATVVEGYDRMRSKSAKGQRQYVTHLFPHRNRWFPYREALCGREYLDTNLVVDEGARFSPCRRCHELAGVS